MEEFSKGIDNFVSRIDGFISEIETDGISDIKFQHEIGGVVYQFSMSKRKE